MGVQEFFDGGLAKVKGTVSTIGIEQQRFLKAFAFMCEEGFSQGWHERNGGNASYRLSAQDVRACQGLFLKERGPWLDLGLKVDGLSREYILVTAAGSYMNRVASDSATNLGIVEIDSLGERYRVVWGFKGGGRPTSELASHVMIHAVRKRVSGGVSRVLYHCHPMDVIALTGALPADSYVLTRALWRVMTECIMVFPEGVGVVGPLVPGSRKLAEATAVCMETQRAVIWAHHGLFVAGDTFDDAFGLAHVIAKAAEIYRCACTMSVASEPRYTVSDDELRAIAESL